MSSFSSMALRPLAGRMLFTLALATCSRELMAAQSAAKNSAGPAIRATAATYTDAFNRGNAKDLAALWTAEGTLDSAGDVLKGRQQIEDKFIAFFKQYPGAKIELEIKAIQFPTPTVAIEDGVAKVTFEKVAMAASSRYTAVHVLEGGKWLMAGVRESAVESPSDFAHLNILKWMIGKWQAKFDDMTLISEFHWIADKSFIQRDYTTRRGGVITSTGTQIIGWDPGTNRLHSWSFDSSGGHGTGAWLPTPDGWQIEMTGVEADGTPTSSINCLIRPTATEGIMGWRSMNRKIGAASLPNTPEIVFDRISENK